MRITKTIAEDIAKSLLAKKLKEIEELKADVRVYAHTLALANIPQEVLDFAKKHPSYLTYESGIRFTQSDFGHQYTTFRFPNNVKLPLKTEYIEVKRSERLALGKLQDKVDDAEKEYRKNLREVETAIFNLRTIAKVRAELPEAIPYLPKEQTSALAIRMDKIREIISQ